MRRALLLWRLIQPCAHQEFTEREKMLRTMRRGYMQALNFVSNLVRSQNIVRSTYSRFRVTV